VAHAGYYSSDILSPPRPFSFELQSTSYSDIGQNENSPKTSLTGTLNVNLNARLYKIFSLFSSFGTTTQSNWSYYGLGIKVDLPGFFFISARPDDLVRSKKLHTTNTYIAVSKMFTHEVSQNKNFMNDKIGLGVDVFISASIYLNLELGVLSYQGNQFLAPAIGMGYEF